MKTGIELIEQERAEQRIKHSFSVESDQKYKNGELILLIEFLLKSNNDAEKDNLREVLLDGTAGCVFEQAFLDKLDSKTNTEKLAIAGAFLAAEIDRIQNLVD